MANFHGLRTKHEKIEALLAVPQESQENHPAGERLNSQERRFFFKHPDIVCQVLAGERSHVRVNAILRKMSFYALGIDDLEAIWKVLQERRQQRPETPK